MAFATPSWCRRGQSRRKRCVALSGGLAALLVAVVFCHLTARLLFLDRARDDVPQAHPTRRSVVLPELSLEEAASLLVRRGEANRTALVDGIEASLVLRADVTPAQQVAYERRWLGDPAQFDTGDRRVRIAVAAMGRMGSVATAARLRQLRSVRDNLLLASDKVVSLDVVGATAAGDVGGADDAARVIAVWTPAFVRSVEVWDAQSIVDAIEAQAAAKGVGSRQRRAVCRGATLLSRSCYQAVVTTVGVGASGYDLRDRDEALRSAAAFVTEHPLVEALLHSAAVSRALTTPADFYVAVRLNVALFSPLTLAALRASEQPAAVLAKVSKLPAAADAPRVAELSLEGASQFALAVEEGPPAAVRHFASPLRIALGRGVGVADDGSSTDDAFFAGTSSRILRHPRYAARSRGLLVASAGGSTPQVLLPLHGGTSILDGNTLEGHVAFANAGGAAFLRGYGHFCVDYFAYVAHLDAAAGANRAAAALRRFVAASSSRMLGYFVERQVSAAAANGACVLDADRGAAAQPLNEVSGFYNTKAFKEELLTRRVASVVAGREVRPSTHACLIVGFVDFHSVPVMFDIASVAAAQLTLPSGSQTVYGRSTRSPMQRDRMFCQRYRVVRGDADSHGFLSSHATIVGTVVFERAAMDECEAAFDVDSTGMHIVLLRANNVRLRCRTFLHDFGADVAVLPNTGSARRGTCLSEEEELEPTQAVFVSPARDPFPTVSLRGRTMQNPFLATVRCALCEHRDLTTAAVKQLEDEMLQHASADREHL